jgi:hypothetical protein
MDRKIGDRLLSERVAHQRMVSELQPTITKPEGMTSEEWFNDLGSKIEALSGRPVGSANHVLAELTSESAGLNIWLRTGYEFNNENEMTRRYRISAEWDYDDQAHDPQMLADEEVEIYEIEDGNPDVDRRLGLIAESIREIEKQIAKLEADPS